MYYILTRYKYYSGDKVIGPFISKKQANNYARTIGILQVNYVVIGDKYAQQHCQDLPIIRPVYNDFTKLRMN